MKGVAANSRRAAGTVLVISPHLDDAVLACGCLLALWSRFCRVVVATVLAGKPKGAPPPFTEWDGAGGFAPGDDVVGRRREEDRQALAVVGARPRWLPFTDSQYGERFSPLRIAARLYGLLHRERPALVLFPLGLFHSDHRLVRDAVLVLIRRRAARQARWLAYEDAFYRRIPGLLKAGVERLRRRGLQPRRERIACSPWRMQRKREAVFCYASQLRALATPGRPGHADAFAAEGYWRLRRP